MNLEITLEYIHIEKYFYISPAYFLLISGSLIFSFLCVNIVLLPLYFLISFAKHTIFFLESVSCSVVSNSM